MNNKRPRKITLPVPEARQGFPNDPRPDGVYFEDASTTDAPRWRVTVREGSVIRREPENVACNDTPWWYEPKHE